MKIQLWISDQSISGNRVFLSFNTEIEIEFDQSKLSVAWSPVQKRDGDTYGLFLMYDTPKIKNKEGGGRRGEGEKEEMKKE